MNEKELKAAATSRFDMTPLAQQCQAIANALGATESVKVEIYSKRYVINMDLNPTA